MSTAAVGYQATADELKIRESASLGPSPFLPNGNVLIQVIRPGLGTGRGRHLYPREMLREHATIFTGAKMYMNHLSEQAQRALGGLPRPIEQLGGRIVRSWWDDSIPADDKFERGAILAEARPTRFMRQLIEDDPELVATSINTDATSVRPTKVGGKVALLVEGMKPPTDEKVQGSVDWVTAAGCGGKVISMLQEADYSSDREADMANLESLTDDELIAHIRETRPSLAEALTTGDGSGGGTGDDTTHKEEEVALTPESLKEALSVDENRAVLVELFGDEIERRAASKASQLIEANVRDALVTAREELSETSRVEAARRAELVAMALETRKLVEGTRLPDEFKGEIIRSYSVSDDGTPTPALKAIFPDFDASGAIAKSSMDKLREAITGEQGEIRRWQRLYAAAAPTQVRGAGLKSLREATEQDGKGDGGEEPKTEEERKAKDAEIAAGAPLVEAMFRDAGISGRVPLSSVWS